jgi:hypothetical protein
MFSPEEFDLSPGRFVSKGNETFSPQFESSNEEEEEEEEEEEDPKKRKRMRID